MTLDLHHIRGALLHAKDLNWEGSMLHQPERLLGTCLLALTGGFLLACNSPVSPGDSVDSSMLSPANGNSPVIEQDAAGVPLGTLTGAQIAGMGSLTRASDGIWFDVEASGTMIEAMDAFTTWAFIFNNPSACVSGCGFDDLPRPSVGAVILNFGGGVDDGDGVLDVGEVESHLGRNSTGGAQILFPPDAPPGKLKGVKNPYQAEIHVVLRNHGLKESDPDDLADQTSMVGAFCNLPDARDTDTPGPPPNFDGCSDQLVFVFLPPGAPGAN